MNSEGSIADVIVVGSGPAGCAAALTCAKAGLHVIVITAQTDHDSSNRVESIHPGVVSLLDKIGIDGPEPQCIFGYYEGIYTSGHYTALGEDVEETWQGLHIWRNKFDQQLNRPLRHRGITIV
ncbi:MAG TPA: FAD-dependent oxidoreductase, partial [Saprospiraceae bacterium]|nr:FAD-dependent oxidoreductase [Saprospiraceae bacterium]